MNGLFRGGIIGTGSYVPPKIVTNKDLEKIVDTSDEWIVARTGIRERRIADPSMATSDMATEAARRALESSGMEAKDIDLIIVATVTPDVIFHLLHALYKAILGLPTRQRLT